METITENKRAGFKPPEFPLKEVLAVALIAGFISAGLRYMVLQEPKVEVLQDSDGKLKKVKKGEETSITRVRFNLLDGSEIHPYQILISDTFSKRNTLLIKSIDQITMEEAMTFVGNHCQVEKQVNIPYPDGHIDRFLWVTDQNCVLERK